MTPSYLGSVGDTGVYSLSLGGIGLSTIQSITIRDDNIVSGGTGAASGFDLDFIKLSSTSTTSASTASSLAGLAVFDFVSRVSFQRGFEQAWSVGDTASWNRSYLFGTSSAGAFLPGTASLAALDGSNGAEFGAVSLGEGGYITFTFAQPVSTSGLYLYFGDVGGGNDGVYVVASDATSTTSGSGITVTGTSGADDMRFGVGFNATIGAGDDNISGSGGNDSIGGAAGNDTLAGNAGNDVIDGGTGIDVAAFGFARSLATITHFSNGAFQVSSNAEGIDQVTGVEQFRFSDGLYSFQYKSPGGVALANFAAGAGGWSSQDAYPRHLADMNGDGYGDIVGFGIAGVLVSYGGAGGTFSQASVAVANFGQNAGWTSDNQFHRELADINADGRADIVGFGISGVYASLGSAGGFGNAQLVLANFNPGNGWSNQDSYTRLLADVNGDGRADIVGFGQAGTLVALAQAGGTFGAAKLVLSDFGAAQGWTSDRTFHRVMADVNGDGRADIVGFGQAGVLVALADGAGGFFASKLGLANFNPGSGWANQDAYPRLAADVNGDGKADIVGFGQAGVLVAFSKGDGTFSDASLDLANFGQASGWSSDGTYHRELADMNHDNQIDIVGFGQAGVYIAQHDIIL
ncbi:FG-GAP-like repeat-containing protein [Novosphingobium bradum]|uniref:FG-GAP-like repeat-containing protein n=1 Tax=Novosphingobium bradum TaxID=1737444 RepID=A0ABV7IMF8_9SPHN